MSEQRNGERIWNIIERVGVCMLTTQAAGRLRAPRGRPRQSKNGKTLLQKELNEVVLVNERGRHRRMSKRQAYFKTLVNRALKEPRYAALLMKTMEQYDLVKDEQVPTCMRIEFVRARHEDDDEDPGNA